MPAVTVTVVVTDPSSDLPQLPTGVDSALRVRMQNATGADLALPAGDAPATFTVKLPFQLFEPEQLEPITVTTPGWRITANTAKYALLVQCTEARTWANGAYLEFDLGHVISTVQPPASAAVAVSFSGITGAKLPVSTTAPLTVASEPPKGAIPLEDVLDVSLDDQGVVYVSSAADPLRGALRLNLKNTSANPLSIGGSQPGDPQVQVSFIYGNTSGALAADESGDGSPPEGSAWNIKVELGPSETTWSGRNPVATSNATDPTWLIWPAKTNTQVLGPRDSSTANASFDFTQIASFTPPGHTQIVVLCTGFRKSAEQAYADHTFVLDIVKQEPPPTRGVLAYYGPEPIVNVAKPGDRIEVPLRWSMLGVASVRLITTREDVPHVVRTYHDVPPLHYDDETLKLSAPNASEPLFTTLQAFDGKGNYLNSQQFVAFLQVAYVRDPAGRVYPVGRFGDTLWMLENYAYDPGTLDNGTWQYAAEYGRLYDWQAAQTYAPAGWKLPTTTQWEALLRSFGDDKAAYAALIHGGDSGYDARLGGEYTISQTGPGSFSEQKTRGLYWTAERTLAQFSKSSETAILTTRRDPLPAMSVRYVRGA